MDKMQNIESIIDRTKNNEKVEKYQKVLKDVDVYQKRLEKVKAAKAKFSEKVFQKVSFEYEQNLKDVKKKIAPIKKDIKKELEEFNTISSEISLLKQALTEELEEIELRYIAEEISEEGYQEKISTLKPQLDNILQNIEILNANTELYTKLLKGDLSIIPETIVTPESQSPSDKQEETNEEEQFTEGAADFEDEEEVEDFTENDSEDAVPIEGSSDDLDSWHEIEDDEEIAEKEAEPEDSVPFYEQEKSDEEEIEQNLDQTLEENFNLDLPEDLRHDLEDQEETTPADFPPDVQTEPYLQIVEGDTEESELSLSNDVVTIGRGPDNDLQLANDTSVSRHHSRVTLENGEYIITDLDSSNGTYVNGERVTQIALTENDEVSIGQTLLLFKFRPVE